MGYLIPSKEKPVRRCANSTSIQSMTQSGLLGSSLKDQLTTSELKDPADILTSLVIDPLMLIATPGGSQINGVVLLV